MQRTQTSQARRQSIVIHSQSCWWIYFSNYENSLRMVLSGHTGNRKWAPARCFCL